MRNLLSPMIQDSMVKWSQRLFNAAQGGDADFAHAALKECQKEIGSMLDFIERLGDAP